MKKLTQKHATAIANYCEIRAIDEFGGSEYPKIVINAELYLNEKCPICSVDNSGIKKAIEQEIGKHVTILSEEKIHSRITLNLFECLKNNPWTKAHRNVTHQLALLVGAKDAALRLRKEAAEGDDWAGTEEERRVALNTIVK